MTYTYCKKIIDRGNYDKEDMLDKLDVYFLAERITKEEYNELDAEINGGEG